MGVPPRAASQLTERLEEANIPQITIDSDTQFQTIPYGALYLFSELALYFVQH